MISSPTLESAKEQAFELVRRWAPCRMQVSGDVFEEWTLKWEGQPAALIA